MMNWPTLPPGAHNHRQVHDAERGVIDGRFAGIDDGFNVRTHGATGNGTTNDTSAVVAALNAVPVGGTLVFPAGTYLLSSWTSPAVNKRIHVVAEGDVTVIGPGTQTFLSMRDSLVVRGRLRLQGFARGLDFSASTGVIDRIDIEGLVTAGVANPIYYSNASTSVGVQRLRIVNCHLTGPGAQAVYFACGQVRSAYISGNTIRTFTSRGIHIGQDVFAQQDQWEHIIVTGNDVRDIIASTAASAHGIIVYGRYAQIHGNVIRDVRTDGGPDSSAVYTKCRLADVHHNTCIDAGNGEAALNVKGQQSGSTSAPGGYRTRYNDNLVIATPAGVAVTTFHGVQIANEDVELADNWFVGLNGVPIQWSASASGDNVTVEDNWLLGCTGDFGIRRSGRGKQHVIVGNRLLDSGAIDIRATDTGGDTVEILRNHVRRTGTSTAHPCVTLNMGAGFAVPEVIIKGNDLIGGGRGVHVTGEAPQSLVLEGNDFRGQALAAVVLSSTPASIRRRDNRGYTTEAFGSATIANGSSTATVNHGLVASPTSVTVTPRTGELVWVSARTGTTFTVSRAGTSGALAVDWAAQVV